MSAQLFKEIDQILDRTEIERILLTLEEDLIKYEAASKDLEYYKDQLSFIDKLNPFGEREKKGEILKIEYEMADIAKIYNQDMLSIQQKAAAAIKSVDAFLAKFQMDWLIRSIANIEAKYYGGGKANYQHSGIQIIGKKEAVKRAKELNITLQDTYGSPYVNCPPYNDFITEYMQYLTDPFHLPLKLEVP